MSPSPPEHLFAFIFLIFHIDTRHKQGKTLAGIVYLHRILDNRVGGVSARNFKMFRNLCGDSSLQNVVIATTMWGQVDSPTGVARETELATKDIFFKPVLEKGGRLARHEGTIACGQSILRLLFNRPPTVLQIQRELESGMDLTQTAAGKEVTREINAQIAQHQSDIRQIVEEIKEAGRLRDEQTRQELTQEREKLQREILRVQTESDRLASGYVEAFAKLEAKMKDKETEKAAKRARWNSECGIDECEHDRRKVVKAAAADNAVLEAKLGAAIPVFGFWGKLAVMLAPFSLSWK